MLDIYKIIACFKDVWTSLPFESMISNYTQKMMKIYRFTEVSSLIDSFWLKGPPPKKSPSWTPCRIRGTLNRATFPFQMAFPWLVLGWSHQVYDKLCTPATFPAGVPTHIQEGEVDDFPFQKGWCSGTPCWMDDWLAAMFQNLPGFWNLKRNFWPKVESTNMSNEKNPGCLGYMGLRYPLTSRL